MAYTFISVAVTFMRGTGAVGTVAASGNISVTVSGVSATGAISSVNVWGIIDASQSPSWSQIAA